MTEAVTSFATFVLLPIAAASFVGAIVAWFYGDRLRTSQRYVDNLVEACSRKDKELFSLRKHTIERGKTLEAALVELAKAKQESDELRDRYRPVYTPEI